MKAGLSLFNAIGLARCQGHLQAEIAKALIWGKVLFFPQCPTDYMYMYVPPDKMILDYVCVTGKLKIRAQFTG